MKELKRIEYFNPLYRFPYTAKKKINEIIETVNRQSEIINSKKQTKPTKK